MINYFSVIVLYNKRIDESLTYNKISSIGYLNNVVVILDNSTDLTVKDFNHSYSENQNIFYEDMKGNVGLSKAYNKFLDKYVQNKVDDVIIWLDDDTNITREYFEELNEIMSKQVDVEIATPIIRGQDGKIWSPNNDSFLKNRQLKNVNEKVDVKRYNAINSCTAVRASVYKDYRYNEELFLDQVDHLFFYHQREQHATFFQMNSIITHEFSLKSNEVDKKILMNRYNIMIPDFLKYGEIRGVFRPLIYTKILGWGIKESIRLKDLTFFLWLSLKMIESDR